MGRGDFGSIGRGFDGGIGGRRRGDRLDLGQPVKGGVYPRKGKGWGQQGEAAYPDLLDAWDRRANWQSWRKGMKLARTQLTGGAERWSGVEALYRNGYTRLQRWRTSPVLIQGFTSSVAPGGRWHVAVKLRGSEISTQPVGEDMREVFSIRPDQGESAGLPWRLVRLAAKAAPVVNLDFEPLHLNTTLIGEVLEDSAIGPAQLASDPTDGIGLMCVAVDEEAELAFFDATRYWRRERTEDGRLILKEIPVSPQDPVPRFRADRYLTQMTTVSCNCPVHLGMTFAKLQASARLGSQRLFPQASPSGLDQAKQQGDSWGSEGVWRSFGALSWDRVPGDECKHCHATRWLLGVPMAEPSDMPSLDADYWGDRDVMALLEEVRMPLSDPRFSQELDQRLLREQALSELDMTLLAASVGDVLGITPRPVPLDPVQVKAIPEPLAPPPVVAPPPELQAAAGTPEAPRFNEQHLAPIPEENERASFGDWHVGRGTATRVLLYEGPGKVNLEREALMALQNRQLLGELLELSP